jgi:2-oxoglutarate ferredoxin oxidoreductase subunit gamma
LHKRKEIRISGFGGQGVVLSGEIIGKAASIYDKGFATLTQSYGPEARGGSCTAEVVISDQPVGYPYVANPEVIIILAQEAYHRYASNRPSHKHRLLSIPVTHMAREMGRPVVANIIMLGFLAAVGDVVPREALRESVLSSVPEGTQELNLRAFDAGYAYGTKHDGTDSEAGRPRK